MVAFRTPIMPEDGFARDRRHTAIQEAAQAHRKERISGPVLAAIGDLHGVIADTRDALHLARSDDDLVRVFDTLRARLCGIAEDTLADRRADLLAGIAAEGGVSHG